MKLDMLVGLGPSHIMLDGDPAPPKKGTAPNFRLMSVVAKRLDGLRCHNWYRGRPLPRIHCVRGGPSCPPKGAQQPHFTAHVYCGQRAGCVSIPLGTEVSLGPCDIVLDGDPAAPTERGTAAFSHFSAHAYCGQTVAHLSYC